MFVKKFVLGFFDKQVSQFHMLSRDIFLKREFFPNTLLMPLWFPKELQITIAGSKKLKWGWSFLDILKKPHDVVLYKRIVEKRGIRVRVNNMLQRTLLFYISQWSNCTVFGGTFWYQIYICIQLHWINKCIWPL